MPNNHLLKRKSVWYYRRRVPDHLIPAFGQSYIQQSLKTRSTSEARKHRNILDVRYDAEFDALSQARIGVDDQAVEGRLKRLASGELADRVAAYVEEQVAKFEKRFVNNPPNSATELEDMRREKEIDLQTLVDPGHPDQHLAVHRTYERLFQGRDLDDVTEPEAAEIVRRGLISILRQELRIQRSEFETIGSSPTSPRATIKSEPTFGMIAAEFLEQEREKARLNKRSKQWVEKLEAHVAVLTEIIGDRTPVLSVDYDAARRVQSLLTRIPAHREKLYPGLSIEAVIERSASKKQPLLSSSTQKSYLGVLRNVLALAFAKRLIPNNPASDIRPLTVDPRSASEKRAPFSAAQISQFFGSEFYARWHPGCTNPYRKADRDWRFWLPLFMAMNGMRPGEICQMLVGDIKQHPSGFWVADVVPTADDDGATVKKRLKTATSKRSFPIHPRLIDVGLPDFVNHRRKSGETALLFDDLAPSVRGYYSDYPCRRFRETFLGQAITMEPGQTFYSFRHAFRDALRRLNAPSDVLLALAGWSEGTKVSDNYGDPKSPDYLFQYVSGIDYPDLKLDFHYVL